MKQEKIDTSEERFIQIFSVEPLGKILVDWLHLPLSFIGATFAFIYFGVLLILHFISGHPFPLNMSEVFQQPVASYYYPNLIAITYDLIGNPLYIVILAFVRKDIPKQLTKLHKNKTLVENNSMSLFYRISKSLRKNKILHILIIVIVPLIISIALIYFSVSENPPIDLPGKYAVFLSVLGIYASSTIFIQLAFTMLILYSYTFTPKLQPKHPDKCSGIAPFGNLAIISYLFLFNRALFQAVVYSEDSGLSEVLNLWLFFPIFLLIIFDLLIYMPHRFLVNLQQEYLEKSNIKWQSYRKSIFSTIEAFVGSKEKNALLKEKIIAQDIEILDIWNKLDAQIVDMNTWPISRSTFRTISVFSNPLIPLLLPIIIESIGPILP